MRFRYVTYAWFTTWLVQVKVFLGRHMHMGCTCLRCNASYGLFLHQICSLCYFLLVRTALNRTIMVQQLFLHHTTTRPLHNHVPYIAHTAAIKTRAWKVFHHHELVGCFGSPLYVSWASVGLA
uniref:Uncharacterized protein n=1 Tax=Anopheles culicifacies TaxID=139723 RepID=A0A182MU70_9DIPT